VSVVATIIALLRVVLAILSLRGVRWAYVSFIAPNSHGGRD
jgi:hypothetical protein